MTPFQRHIFAATVLAAALRLVYVLVYPQVEPPCPDCGMYDRAAVNLAAGRGLVYDGDEAERLGIAGPVIAFGPVYPAFLATIYRAVGHHFTAVRVAQAIAGAFIIPIIGSLAMVAFGASAARVAGWLIAVSPPLIAYTGMLLTETLSTLLLACTMWLVMIAVPRQSNALYGAGGVAAGLLILMRQEMALAVAGTALVVWQAQRRHTPLIVYLLTITTCVGAWTARNYMVFRRPVLVTSKGGEQLWLAAKGWSEWRFDDPEYLKLVRGHDPIERDSILRRDAVRMIVGAPGSYVARCFTQIPELWISSHTSYIRGLPDTFRAYAARGAWGRLALKAVFLGVHIVLLALAVWGAAFARRAAWSLSASLIALPIGVVSVVYFFLFATARYQVPALPFVLVFAGVALAQIAALDARAGTARAVSRIG